jgi:hypothetical protein
MEASILKSTKKILGLDEMYVAFDLDIITHINATFAVLHQLGIGPEVGFSIEDETDVWSDFEVPLVQVNLVKTYLYLKVRALFDPPTMSFLIESTNKQLEEYEWRLSINRENSLPTPVIPPTEV